MPHGCPRRIVFWWDGPRPEGIKLPPVVAALQARGDFDVRCCITGQHRELRGKRWMRWRPKCCAASCARTSVLRGFPSRTKIAAMLQTAHRSPAASGLLQTNPALAAPYRLGAGRTSIQIARRVGVVVFRSSRVACHPSPNSPVAIAQLNATLSAACLARAPTAVGPAQNPARPTMIGRTAGL